MGACKGQASRDHDSLSPCAARMAHRRWETETVARTSQGPAKTLDSSDRPVSMRAPALAQGAGGGAPPMAYLTARVSRSEALPLGAAAMVWCAAHPYTRARGDSRACPLRLSPSYASGRCERSLRSMANRRHAVGLLVLCAVMW